MTEERFEELVEEQLEMVRQVLIEKAKEYRRNANPFHNFDKGSKRTGLSREKVIDGFLLKHEISISDITDDVENQLYPSLELLDEKFTDNINYLIIKKLSIIDKIKNKLKDT